MRKILLVLLFVSAVQLTASTIIVNSIYNTDLNPDSASAAAAVEDGLMESLFDYGFIMFSTVNSPDYSVEGAKDARYMISIEPMDEEFSVSFTLQATVNGMIIDSGIVDLTNIRKDSHLDKRKLYYLIGGEVAAELEQFF